MNPRPPLDSLPAEVDLVIIGGGITGAGVFAEAVARGYRVLLVERNDFASGTSSWSSKLVHGGLRYLKSGQWQLTRESLRERNRLLHEWPQLVRPQSFLMPVYEGQSPGLTTLRLGLAIYDLLGGRGSRQLSAAEALALEPDLRQEGLRGAVAYEDATTDDVQLVLRTIGAVRQRGGVEHAIARNHCRVEQVLHSGGRVRGVALLDELDGQRREIEAKLVIDAAGVDADRVPGAPAGAPTLRPLRGSHLIFPLARLPLGRAVSWLHPRDRRPVFAYPWKGVLLFGTTDVDHSPGEALRISADETTYLLEALERQFPNAKLTAADALCATAGVRPIVAGGKAAPSAESRESAIWSAPGWVGVTGGKLTTFAHTAKQVMDRVKAEVGPSRPASAPLPSCGASGATRIPIAHTDMEGDWEDRACDADLRDRPIEGTPYRWSELLWCASQGHDVAHLDDLLMRRLRLSLLLPRGGASLLPEMEPIVCKALGWDSARWQAECARYLDLWDRQHAVTPP